MEINFLTIFGAAVLAMVVGAIWYGPLFGRKWLQIIGADPDDLAAREKMQREAGPTYVLQFVLVLLQLYILAHFVKASGEGVESALWIWLGFVMPTLAAASMWTTDSSQVKWARFLIQAGYQFVMFALFGYILSVWA